MYRIRVLSYDKNYHSKAFISSINELYFDCLDIVKSYIETTTYVYPGLILEVY